MSVAMLCFHTHGLEKEGPIGLLDVQARSGRVTLLRVKVVPARAARFVSGALAERRAERTALCFKSADAIVVKYMVCCGGY
jgi:hypothetical protein